MQTDKPAQLFNVAEAQQVNNQQNVNSNEKVLPISTNSQVKNQNLMLNMQVNSQPLGSSLPSIQNKPVSSF